MGTSLVVGSGSLEGFINKQLHSNTAPSRQDFKFQFGQERGIYSASPSAPAEAVWNLATEGVFGR